MASIDVTHVFCDTSLAVENAAAVLRTSRVLSFDCEGEHLGCSGGRLSLISLRNFEDIDSQTYLIDALRVSKPELRPIYDILKSRAIRKVLYDGRNDFNCLLHDCGVEIKNVVDLQLADIKSRQRRGEHNFDRLCRLSATVPRRELEDFPHLYVNIHKLSGMKECAKEHLELKAERNTVKFDHSLWLNRPLSAEYLKHAVEDVVIIGQLYTAFVASGYLYPQLVHDSARYVSIWRDRLSGADDIYRNHGLLILDIVYRLSGPMGKCTYCDRMLPQPCFSASIWAGDPEYLQCLVCAAVLQMHLQREAAKDRANRGGRSIWRRGARSTTGASTRDLARRGGGSHRGGGVQSTSGSTRGVLPDSGSSRELTGRGQGIQRTRGLIQGSTPHGTGMQSGVGTPPTPRGGRGSAMRGGAPRGGTVTPNRGNGRGAAGRATRGRARGARRG